jgi:hypothetical protein
VAIVGAGLIGCSWANVFARAGWNVRVWDPSPASGTRRTRADRPIARRLQGHGLVQDAAAAAARVQVVATLEDAVQSADYVQESGPEVLEVKRETFAALDAAAPPHCVLASSTSAIVASQLHRATRRPRALHRRASGEPAASRSGGRALRARRGRPKRPRRGRARYAARGPDADRRPARDRRLRAEPSAGRAVDRGIRLVQDGVVSPRDLDHTVADGLGLRWAFMGPFETIELNAPRGIADYCERYVPWFRRYVADLPTSQVWDDAQWGTTAAAWGPAPTESELAEKSAWRDDRLAALVAHKRTRKPAPDS